MEFDVRVTFSPDTTPEERTRALRIIEAAKLQIRDRAPELFTGPAPVNTNPFDVDNYQH